MKRILEVTKHFDIPAVVCVNKEDINIENTKKLEEFCKQNSMDIVGKLPYDNITTDSMIEGKTVIEHSRNQGEFANRIRQMWKKIQLTLEVS
jgi:MinD superfamily P-loop ATPase